MVEGGRNGSATLPDVLYVRAALVDAAAGLKTARARGLSPLAVAPTLEAIDALRAAVHVLLGIVERGNDGKTS